MTYFGVESIAGSTRRGGSAALRTMLKRLDAGRLRRHHAGRPARPGDDARASGIVNLARLAGVPIVPITFATSRRRVLRTWDRFHLALPFGRGVFLWGEPIEVAADLDAAGLEQRPALVETPDERDGGEADRRVGHRSQPPLLAAERRQASAPPASAD